MAAYNGDLKKRHYKMGILLTEKRKREILKENFKKRVGYELDLDNPKAYNEKIMWMKLNYQDPLITTCADKYAVKDYITKTIGEEYIVPNIAKWDNPEDICFDELPNRFVLKVNWASGYNIICKDKSKLNTKSTVEQLKKWMAPDRNSYYQLFNWGYKNMKPVVYAEEYIEQSNGQVYDYKFLTSFGKVKAMLIATDRDSKNGVTYDFFDRDFNHLPLTSGGGLHANPLPEKPKSYEKMIELAEKLAKPFPFVRVDFYEIENKIYVGEMTFYPGGGILPVTPREWDYKMGEWFELPPRTIIDKPVPFFALKYPVAKIKECVKTMSKKIRRVILRHDVLNKKHYIVLFGKFRFPFTTYVENEEKHIAIEGMEFKYKKNTSSSKYDELPDPDFTILTPREAYMMENQISIEMKKHYCEQKAYKQLGYFPNLDDPKSLNEKLIWLALYYNHPNLSIASDKFRAKQWVTERIGSEYVVPLIGAYSNINDIDFDSLPNQFVIKANAGWGAGQVILVKDKTRCNIEKLKAVVSPWLYPWSSYYYNNMCITCEKPERPMIVIEEFLKQGDQEHLDDYKLYVCNGKVKFALIVNERGSETEQRTYVDVDWNVLPVKRAGKFLSETPKKPENFAHMVELAEKLAEDNPMVRVDFYNINGKLYLGEMTYTPGLFLRFEPKAWDFLLGEYLDLTELMKQFGPNAAK